MWLALQSVYAMVAWSIALRAVVRSARLSGLLDASVLKLCKRLLTAKHESSIKELCDQLGSAPLSEVLRESVSPTEDVFARVDRAVAMTAPPTTALRGLATIGTSLGFLGAIATMRASVDTGGAQRAMAQAIECALLGFVTAIPLWTAVTISGKHTRSARLALDKLADMRDGGSVLEADRQQIGADETD